MALPRLSPGLRQTLSQVMRLGLPLGALVLMSTIFLASRSVDPNRAVALSDLDLETLTREPRIGQARIAGVTADHAAVTIAAAALRSPSDPRARLPLTLIIEGPDGMVRFEDGSDVRFTAAEGLIAQDQNRVLLSQNVALHASNGYSVTLASLDADLDDTVLTGAGPVIGTGPAGQLRADRLTVRGLPGDGNGYLLAFTGDVRLLYEPRQ